MDRVRFGRALGYGARHAAKSLAKAADAAVAPSPRATTKAGTAAASAERTRPAGPIGRQASPQNAGEAPARAQASHPAGSTAQRMAQARAGFARGGAQAGHLRRTVWSPLASFTGVVGLQVSGTFFALVAAFLSQGLWKTRGAAHLGLSWPAGGKFYLHAVAFALFAYFAVSSFVRAHLKQRR